MHAPRNLAGRLIEAFISDDEISALLDELEAHVPEMSSDQSSRDVLIAMLGIIERCSRILDLMKST